MKDEQANKIFSELRTQPKKFLKVDASKDLGFDIKLLGVLHRFRKQLFSFGCGNPQFVIPQVTIESIPRTVFKDWVIRKAMSLIPFPDKEEPLSKAISASLEPKLKSTLKYVKDENYDLKEAQKYRLHLSLMEYLKTTSMEIDELVLNSLKPLWNDYRDKKDRYLKSTINRLGLQHHLSSMGEDELKKIHGRIPIKDLAKILEVIEFREVFMKVLPNTIVDLYEDAYKASSPMDDSVLESAMELKLYLDPTYDPSEDLWSKKWSSSLMACVALLIDLQQDHSIQDRVKLGESLKSQLQCLKFSNKDELDMGFRILWELQNRCISNSRILKITKELKLMIEGKMKLDNQNNYLLSPILTLPSFNLTKDEINALELFHLSLNSEFSSVKQKLSNLESDFKYRDEILSMLPRS